MKVLLAPDVDAVLVGLGEVLRSQEVPICPDARPLPHRADRLGVADRLAGMAADLQGRVAQFTA